MDTLNWLDMAKVAPLERDDGRWDIREGRCAVVVIMPTRTAVEDLIAAGQQAIYDRWISLQAAA